MNAVVEFFPFFPDFGGIVEKKRSGEVFQMRTVAAALGPFFTSELGTPAGKGPVIVQCPDGRDLVFSDIAEKHIDIEIIVAHGMNMDQIGFDLFQFIDEKPGIDHIEITVKAKDVGQSFGYDPVKPGSDIDLILIPVSEADSAFTAAGIDFEAFLSGPFGDIEDDVAGTGIIVAVNFYDRFHQQHYSILIIPILNIHDHNRNRNGSFLLPLYKDKASRSFLLDRMKKELIGIDDIMVLLEREVHYENISCRCSS